MSTAIPEVLTDPIGASVDLVTGLKAGMDRRCVEAVVASVACEDVVLAHPRSVLVATETLPARDEQMARLERFLRDILAARTDPDQRQILHRYTNWHLLRRLRRRNNGQPATHQQYAVVHQHVRAATVLLDWLTARSTGGLSLRPDLGSHSAVRTAVEQVASAVSGRTRRW